MPAAAADDLTELAQQVDRAHLAESRPWLAIGHYRPNWFGGYASEFAGQKIFLSPLGARDPRAELLATLREFARPAVPGHEDDHAQCRYPSRRRYLFAALRIDPRRLPPQPCEKITAWKKAFDADGLSLVFASAYLNNAASMFGHTFLKFHSRTNGLDRDLLNYGVNFAADTHDDGGAAFALKGLFGGYGGSFSLLPYHQTLRQYADLEGRDIWEYRLALDREEVDAVIDHLLEIQQTYFNYYFLDKNCSYQLLALLEAARPSLRLGRRLTSFVIPADAVRVVADAPGLVTETIYRPARATRFRAASSRLDTVQRLTAKRLVTADDAAVEASLAAGAPGDSASRARVLDAALLYASMKSRPGTPGQRDHRLKLARAELGGVAGPETEPSSARRPDEGHDSSLVGVGLGRRGDADYQSVRVRGAYQDLLSRDVGFLPNTRLEILRLEARRYAPGPGIELHELSLLDLQVTTAWTVFFRPLSWLANVGWRRLADRPTGTDLALSLNGGPGIAFEPFGTSSVTVAAFALFNFDAASDLPQGYRIGAAAQGQLLARIRDGWHAGVGVEYRRYALGSAVDVPDFWAGQTVALSRNWEFRLDHRRSADVEENQAVVGWHFLF